MDYLFGQGFFLGLFYGLEHIPQAILEGYIRIE
jgi:hypothetical protein